MYILLFKINKVDKHRTLFENNYWSSSSRKSIKLKLLIGISTKGRNIA